MTSAVPPLPVPASTAIWPPDSLEHLGRCPVCQSADRKVLHTGLTDRLFNCAPGIWTLHRCGACACAYLDPRPDPQSIGLAYSQYFTHDNSDTPSTSAPPTRQGLRAWLRAGLKGYCNARWGMALTPANAWGRWWVPLVVPLRSWQVAHLRHLPRQLPRPRATLLDVGCGNGEFLAMARAAGWQVQGVDFDPLAVASAHKRGLNVRQGGLEQVAHQTAYYDRITCSHVIEHVHDPVQWLQDMVKLLRPGGTLWLQTPNIDSLGHRIFGADWRGLEPPRHLAIFKTHTLLQQFTRMGLTPRLRRLPILSAMALHATSDALRRGQCATRPLRLTELLRMHYLAPALQQAWSVKHAEFITVTATKVPFTEPVTSVK